MIHGKSMMKIALLAFAAVFMGVAVSRIVEFRVPNISVRQRMLLIPLHLIGSALFTGAIVLLAIDPAQERKALMRALFFGAVLTLCPLHIYLGLKRKIAAH